MKKNLSLFAIPVIIILGIAAWTAIGPHSQQDTILQQGPRVSTVNEADFVNASMQNNAMVGGSINTRSTPDFVTLTVECVDTHGELLTSPSVTYYRPQEQYYFTAPEIDGYVTDQNWYQDQLGWHNRTVQIEYYRPIDNLDDLMQVAEKPSLEQLQQYHILMVYDADHQQFVKLFDNAEFTEADVAAYVQHGMEAYDFDKSYAPLSEVELPDVIYIDQDSYLLADGNHLYAVHSDGAVQHISVQTPTLYQDLDQVVTVDLGTMAEGC